MNKRMQEITEKYDHYKVIVIGDSGVGKTSITRRAHRKDFAPGKCCSTVGASFTALKYDDEKMMLNFWDTAGQERYRSIVPIYFKNANVVLMVFDQNRPVSFENILRDWVPLLEQHLVDFSKIILYLVQNKADDDENQKDVTFDLNKIQKHPIFAQTGFNFIKTSAKTGRGVEELLERIKQLTKSEIGSTAKVQDSKGLGIVKIVSEATTTVTTFVGDNVKKIGGSCCQ